MYKCQSLLTLLGFLILGTVGCNVLPLHLRHPDFKPISAQGRYLWPRWSPDGTRIAVEVEEEALLSHIAVMNIDGSELTRITPSQFDARLPDWSPDGKRITFVSLSKDTSEIWTINVDGTEAKQVTQSANRSLWPKWSSNGKYIAFTMRTGLGRFNSELYLMDENGKNIRKLTQYPLGGIENYEWSPDGSAIAFGADRLDEIDQGKDLGEYGQYLYIMNADGTGLRQIDMGGSANLYPTWSPDSKYILVDVEYLNPANKPKSGFYLVESDGSNRHVVLQESCGWPNWSASRNQIVFVCGRLMDGMGSIYIADAKSILH